MLYTDGVYPIFYLQYEKIICDNRICPSGFSIMDEACPLYLCIGQDTNSKGRVMLKGVPCF